ncbi:hypothetical protein [Archaeoglobus profundus]|uniref:Archaeal flagella protein FlaD/E domain-containing protein n=1 Tax=Archaeoglobus profundus (strain DSM 5631 / JCM 9629 / NBRC 100127 / Av18) TaxID=572546 RepID=D2RE94_ARCPA|nr:hypothetical protein [Archaeoglobus profundus]ADB58438.1 hypothetical protein Arcpr_1389 [Archaeoglobus profundus DSM 5631]
MADIDQSTIDQLVATAEADTPESKIAKLEKEVETLKGSIKKLLMDIRETMNNLENPFQSLQNLAEVINRAPSSQPPQQVQVIPTPPPETPKPELKEEKKEEEKREEIEEKKEEVEEKAEEPEEVEDFVKEEVDNVFQVPELKPKKKVREVMPKGVGKRMNIVTLYNMMVWVRRMLEKYDMNTIRDILDLFESAGYISTELKEFTGKIVDIVGVIGDGFDELLIDLYKLHKTVNPNDKSMDSELLKILLEKRGNDF